MPQSSSGDLSSLLTAQDFTGCWTSESAFIGLISTVPSLPDFVIANAPKDTSIQAQVWWTLLALAILETKFADKAGEWELIAKKAKKYLKDQGFKYRDHIAAAKALL